jgi:aspartate/methionine/tyrosine aminotransferase
MSDWAMAKIDEPGVINLAVGEPIFLQKAMKDFISDSIYTGLSFNPNYPEFGGHASLIEELRQWPLFSYKHIVITNGGKQAIAAAFDQIRSCTVDLSAPFWPSYASLAEQANLAVINQTSPAQWRRVDGAWSLKIITSPNNPDGGQVAEKESCYMWDAAYADDVYGWNGVIPDAKMAVFSFAKLFGLSGLRIGAFCTDDAEAAKKAAFFVEQQTSGVSTLSQMALFNLMRACRLTVKTGNMAGGHHMWRVGSGQQRYIKAKQIAREELEKTRQIALQLEDFGKTEGSSVGMFAWFRPDDKEKFLDICHKAKVKIVDGVSCGSKDHVRLSLGVGSETFAQALNRIRQFQ